VPLVACTCTLNGDIIQRTAAAAALRRDAVVALTLPPLVNVILQAVARENLTGEFLRVVAEHQDHIHPEVQYIHQLAEVGLTVDEPRGCPRLPADLVQRLLELG